MESAQMYLVTGIVLSILLLCFFPIVLFGQKRRDGAAVVLWICSGVVGVLLGAAGTYTLANTLGYRVATEEDLSQEATDSGGKGMATKQTQGSSVMSEPKNWKKKGGAMKARTADKGFDEAAMRRAMGGKMGALRSKGAKKKISSDDDQKKGSSDDKKASSDDKKAAQKGGGRGGFGGGRGGRGGGGFGGFGGGRGGGGRGGFGGGRRDNPKRNLTSFVRKLDLLTNDVKISLSADQKGKLSKALDELAKTDELNEDGAKKALETLQGVLTDDQKKKQEAIGLPFSRGRRGRGGGGDENANPFKSEANEKALKSLQGKLK